MKRTLAAGLLLAPGALAQLPPGQFLVTTGGGQGTPGGLAFVEPLRGGVTRVAAPPLPDVRAAILGGSPAEVLVAARLAASQEDRLLLGHLVGAALTGLAPWAEGFAGRITGLARAGGGAVLVCTEETFYAVPSGGGRARPLVTPIVPLGCRDLVLDRGTLFVLADQGRGTVVIWRYDLATAAVQAHPLTLSAASSMTSAPAQAGFLVGDPAGDIHFVDGSRFGVVLLARGGRGPVLSLAHNQDQRNHLFGTVGLVQTLSGSRVGPPIRLLGAGSILHLDYRPYESAFSSYGAGCPGVGGVPRIGSVGRPFPGNASYALTLSGARGLAPTTLLLGARPTDLDLGPLGMPGCRMLVLAEVFVPAVATNTGRATVPLPVPAEPALVGATVHAQWAIFDRGANALEVVTSDGGRSRL